MLIAQRVRDVFGILVEVTAAFSILFPFVTDAIVVTQKRHQVCIVVKHTSEVWSLRRPADRRASTRTCDSAAMRRCWVPESGPADRKRS